MGPTGGFKFSQGFSSLRFMKKSTQKADTNDSKEQSATDKERTQAEEQPAAAAAADVIQVEQANELDGFAGNPGAAAAPAATGTAAAPARRNLLSNRISQMGFMKRALGKRKREEDDEQAARAEEEPEPAAGTQATAAAASTTETPSTPFPAAAAAASPATAGAAAAGGSARKVVIIQENDPMPVGCFGRMSFGGFNPVVEALQAGARGDPPRSKPNNVAPAVEEREDGADVDRQQMASALGGGTQDNLGMPYGALRIHPTKKNAHQHKATRRYMTKQLQ